MKRVQLLLVLDSLVVVVLVGLKAHRMWSVRQKRAQRARDIRLFRLLYHALYSHQK